MGLLPVRGVWFCTEAGQLLSPSSCSTAPEPGDLTVGLGGSKGVLPLLCSLGMSCFAIHGSGVGTPAGCRPYPQAGKPPQAMLALPASVYSSV